MNFSTFCSIFFFFSLFVFKLHLPVVDDVSANPSHGSRVEIQGSSFGTRDDQQPVFHEDFERNANGEIPNTNVFVSEEFGRFTDRGPSSSNPTIVDSHQRHSFSQRCVETRLQKNGLRSVSEMAWIDNLFAWEDRKVYVNVWLWFQWIPIDQFHNYASSAYQIKTFGLCEGVEPNGYHINCTQLYVWRYDGTDNIWFTDDDYTNGYWTNSPIMGGKGSIYFPGNFFPKDDYGSWYNVVMEIDQGSPNKADGSYSFYVSQPFTDETYIKISGNRQIRGLNAFTTLKFGWYLDDNGLDGNLTLYYDDFYVDKYWSRVEIGDNSEYDNCKHREIQKLHSWTDNLVEIDFNQGSFNIGDEVYLFVIDNDGIPSIGYNLTITANDSFSIKLKNWGIVTVLLFIAFVFF